VSSLQFRQNWTRQVSPRHNTRPRCCSDRNGEAGGRGREDACLIYLQLRNSRQDRGLERGHARHRSRRLLVRATVFAHITAYTRTHARERKRERERGRGRGRGGERERAHKGPSRMYAAAVRDASSYVGAGLFTTFGGLSEGARGFREGAGGEEGRAPASGAPSGRASERANRSSTV